MTRRMLTAFAATLVLLTAAGCVDTAFALFGELQGSGKSSTATRTVAPFSKLRLAGSVDAVVKVGEAQSVVVEGDDNLLENVLTTIKGDTLVVSTEKSYSTKIGLRVRITVPSLSALAIDGSADAKIDGVTGPEFRTSINGSGDATIQGTADRVETEIRGSGDYTMGDVAAKSVSVSVHGSGDVRMRGTADTVKIDIHGSGTVNCADVKAKNVDVSIAGSGDAMVYASDALSTVIAGSGDVTYGGNPAKIDNQRHGSGDLKRAR